MRSVICIELLPVMAWSISRDQPLKILDHP
jgi:hypothetical protein